MTEAKKEFSEKRTRSARMWTEVLMSALTGAGFGMAFNSCKMNVPMVLVQQMEMRNFLMMRMFLAATATSAVAIAVLDWLGVRKRVVKEPQTLGSISYGGNILGGFLFGVGMYLTGSCPGTVFAQVAVGAPAAKFVAPLIAGGIAGATAFGYSERTLKDKFGYAKGKPVGIDQVSGVPLVATALGFAGMMACMLYGLNQVFPWKTDMAKVVIDPAGESDPLVGGILIGLLQFSASLSPLGTLGFSSSWVYASAKLAQLYDSTIYKNSPCLAASLNSKKAQAQAVAAMAVVAGAYAATMTSPSELTSQALEAANPIDTGVAGALWAFMGGFSMLYGARLGGGCTSGHGLTGVGSLSLSSMVTVAFMFVGGMLAAFANQKLAPFY